MVWKYSEIVSVGDRDPWLWQRQTFILCSWARNREDRDFIIGQQTRDLYSHDGRSDSVSSEGFYRNATFYKLLLHCQWSRINTNNFHAVIFFPFLMGPLKGSRLCLERRGSDVSKQQYNIQSVTQLTSGSGWISQSLSGIFLSPVLPLNQ